MTTPHETAQAIWDRLNTGDRMALVDQPRLRAEEIIRRELPDVSYAERFEIEDALVASVCDEHDIDEWGEWSWLEEYDDEPAQAEAKANARAI